MGTSSHSGADHRRDELADKRDRIADLRDDAADVRDDLADKRDRSSEGALAFDVDSLRCAQVAGPWGYRFGAVEQEAGGAILAQIIDGDGCEVAWAKGDTKHDLFLDASHKAHEHEANFDKRQGNS
jgi:hypothetical protein